MPPVRRGGSARLDFGLAVFLDSAARKMARAKRGTTYVWDRPFEATSDMFRMFYDLAPVANVGVII